MPALVAGGRYVRHEPVVRRILLRFATFIAPACAVWALLPLIASRQLGLDADGYGLLFAALGFGAVIGALSLGRVKQHLSSNGGAGARGGLLRARLRLTRRWRRTAWLALPLLVVCGFGWTATVSTIISELQLFLPGWVRARAIAIYLMVFLGSQAVAAPIWGQVTQHSGSRTAMLAAAALVARQRAGGLVLKVPENEDLDRAAAGLLGRGTGGAGAGAGRRTDRGVHRVRGLARPGGRLPAGHGGDAPLTTAQRCLPVGPVPGRGEPGPLPGAVPGADLAGAPAPARRTPHRRGPGDRGRGLLSHRGNSAHQTPAPSRNPAQLPVRRRAGAAMKEFVACDHGIHPSRVIQRVGSEARV